MDFKEIMNMQRILDENIQKEHNVIFTNIAHKKIAALLVEISEFANEYFPFKYWKKNSQINRSKLLEEFVDGIHFLISLAIDLKLEDVTFTGKIKNNDLTMQLLATFQSVIKLNEAFNQQNLKEAFELYMGNAQLLKITNEEIQNYYKNKNDINFKRLANNY